jgi:ribonuclease E
LRDLAGLIVIDFIDMDERRNNRLVERRLKEALRHDRARIQVGRISHFGLLEMSRQRLRTGMLEGSTKPCPMCQGIGMVRSVESVALDILRSIEDRLITDGVVPLAATTAVDVALYILNQKRLHLNDIQQRYRVPITVNADEDMHISQFVIERAAEGEIANGPAAVHMDWAHHEEAHEETRPAAPEATAETEAEQPRSRSRRRRRRGRGREGGAEHQRPSHAALPRHEEEMEERAEERPAAPLPQPRGSEAKEDGGGQARKGPRRRGRRGGRRGRAGQRPQRAPGEEGPVEGRIEAQTGAPSTNDANNGRGAAREEEAPARTQSRETFASAVEPEPSREAPADIQSEPETPRRRGWWQR